MSTTSGSRVGAERSLSSWFVYHQQQIFDSPALITQRTAVEYQSLTAAEQQDLSLIYSTAASFTKGSIDALLGEVDSLEVASLVMVVTITGYIYAEAMMNPQFLQSVVNWAAITATEELRKLRYVNVSDQQWSLISRELSRCFQSAAASGIALSHFRSGTQAQIDSHAILVT